VNERSEILNELNRTILQYEHVERDRQGRVKQRVSVDLGLLHVLAAVLLYYTAEYGDDVIARVLSMMPEMPESGPAGTSDVAVTGSGPGPGQMLSPTSTLWRMLADRMTSE